MGLVELKCETDFVAKSPNFMALTQALADSVAAGGDSAAGDHKDAVDDLKVTLKENIEVGRVVQVTLATARPSAPTSPPGRAGRERVVVVLRGGGEELAHDIAVHIAFAKPQYLAREDVPVEVVEDERQALLGVTKAEGKPEAAWPKIVEGRSTAGTRARSSSSPSSATRSRPSPRWRPPGRPRSPATPSCSSAADCG